MSFISVEKCPACNRNTLSTLFKRGDGLPLARCNTCEVLVVCKYPETLNNACSTNRFVKSDGSSVDAGYRDSLNNVSPLDFVRHLATLEAARLAMQKEKRLLLDVGAASGDFLALTHLFGWEDTHGVERSAYSRAVARKLGVIEQYATLENIPSDCHFDFITAWEVIEYLLDLPSFMTALRAHLRSGGIFLCSTPDAGQADFYPRPEEWLEFHVSSEHLSYFTSTALRKVLSQFFPYVMIWTSQSDAFSHHLFAIGFTETPLPQVIEQMHAFQSGGIPACQLSSSQNGWIIPTALMGLHPSPECRAKLRSNYSRLQAALQHVQSAEGRLVGALLGTAVGDLLTARRDMGEFIKHAQRTVIPATIVESLVQHDQGYDQRNSRAERVARLLKRSAAHARACSQVIHTTIKFGVSRGHYPLAWMQLRKILNQHRLVKGIIIYPALVVYSLLRQRPHQLGRALAEQGYLFFFCTGNPQRDKVNGFRQLGQNFYLCSVPFEVFRTIDDPILYISSLAGWRQRVREVTGRDTARIFYDWMDDLAVFGRVENQIDEHTELLHSAEVVAASASLLFAEARKIRPDVLLLPNGVRLEDFQDIADGPALAPAMLQDAVNQKQPIIGYYGSISSWFDFDLFQHVLEMNPEKLFIMIGKVWGLGATGLTRWQQLNQVKNLVYVEHVDYTELGGYLRWFDVAIIPFVLNTITHATSPVKLFEYMAAGKPIVTTGMLECKKYESVLWGNTAAEFSDRLTQALTLWNDQGYLATLRKEALDNTWAERANTLDRAFSKHRA